MEPPADLAHLLDGPHTAVLTTLLPDGSPQSTPVWFLRQGDEIVVSSRTGQQKHRNVVRDARVALTVVDPANPMSYVEVRGTAVAEDDPAYAGRDAVVRKHGYADGSAFDPPGTRRVVLRIRPHRITGR